MKNIIVSKITLPDGSEKPDIKEGSKYDSFFKISENQYMVEGLTQWGNSPIVIQTFQGKLLLKRLGLLETIDAMIKEAGQEEEIYWEYATEWERTSPIIARLAPMIGWGESELDDFFTNAALIK